ncbi:MAG: CRISPR-associated endonuclease Cas1 [Acidimicrobiales bacterium]|nr:CRISPR-associated endonuclease Cas1 [Acidimicrobiales bacterium]
MDRTEPTVVLSAFPGSPQAGGDGLDYQALPLSAEDVADDAGRRVDTYSRVDSLSVAVVDGFGARISVERGHLELIDGVGEHRRIRRYAKVDGPSRVVVGIGTAGAVSFDALRWCSATGSTVIVLGRDGAILAAGPPGREDARLLRAQAFALYGPTGVEVSRYLIAEKLRGQARVLGMVMNDERSASTVLRLAEDVATYARSIDEIRQIEAAGANVYFARWEQAVTVVFARKDLARIPEHWSRFNGRRSSVNLGSPRSATDPAGAILNYAYKLAEIEAAVAARRMGLDPGIGILHADVAGRPSFACDLMEAIRPVVDLHVLGLLAGPLRKREFTEDARGVVRCLAPITHHLAEAMPSYGKNLAPVTERVALILAGSSPYDVRVPTALSREKHRVAARKRVAADWQTGEIKPTSGQGPNPGGLSPRGRRKPKSSLSPPLPLQACRGCGCQLPIDADRDRPRISWCPNCLAGRRSELGSSLQAASQRAGEQFARETGSLPTHTADARAARSEGNARQRSEQAAYEPASGPVLDAEWYGAVVQPMLAGFTLPAIAKETGVSTSAAAKWRAGRTTPHRRHWLPLAELVGVDLPTW